MGSRITIGFFSYTEDNTFGYQLSLYPDDMSGHLKSPSIDRSVVSESSLITPLHIFPISALTWDVAMKPVSDSFGFHTLLFATGDRHP